MGSKEHAVIAGRGRVGFRIAGVFKGIGLPLVVVELIHRRVESAHASGIAVVYGDARQKTVLEANEIGTALLLVVTTSDVVTARTAISNAKHRNDGLGVVALASDSAFLPYRQGNGCQQCSDARTRGQYENDPQALTPRLYPCDRDTATNGFPIDKLDLFTPLAAKH